MSIFIIQRKVYSFRYVSAFKSQEYNKQTKSRALSVLSSVVSLNDKLNRKLPLRVPKGFLIFSGESKETIIKKSVK